MATDNNIKETPSAPSEKQDERLTQARREILLLQEKEAVTKRDKGIILAVVIVTLVIAAVALCGFLFIKPEPDTIQGMADATEIRISGKLPGRVERLFVQEGDYVHKGDTLVQIHSSLVDARKSQAEAMEQVARAGNEKVDAGTRVQIINSARDVWSQAQAARDIAEKTYNRMENLYSKGVISAQKRDEAKAAYEAAVAGEAAAKSQYELAKEGAQREDKQASAAMLRAAQGSVKEVDAVLEDQYLVAPCDGQITVIYPEVSELVATGAPLMSLQTADRHAVFNVRETSLRDMQPGYRIRTLIPALDKEVDMEIYYVKDMGSYASWQATKATGDYDARTFEVKAKPVEPISGFLPGMSVIYLSTTSKDAKADGSKATAAKK